jgi:hypothetical protein
MLNRAEEVMDKEERPKKRPEDKKPVEQPRTREDELGLFADDYKYTGKSIVTRR